MCAFAQLAAQCCFRQAGGKTNLARWKYGHMDMKELAAPMVLNLIQSGNSSSDLAQQLSGFIDEESFSETRKSFAMPLITGNMSR